MKGKEKKGMHLASLNANLHHATGEIKDAVQTSASGIKNELQIAGRKVADVVFEVMDDVKASRIKKSIIRHETKLKELQQDLRNLAGAHF